MTPTAERIEELLEIVDEYSNISNYDRFQYHNWDGLIEDEEMSDEELDWIRENFVVTVTVELKD